MSSLTKPYDFTGGTYAIASQVNADLDTLYNWVNGGDAIWADASVAFTGVPTGPSLDPTAADHLTRKSYVDAQTTAAENWAAANCVQNISPGAYKLQGGKSTVTANASGVFTITFGAPFPTALVAVVMNVDSGSGNAQYAQPSSGTYSKTSVQGRAMTANNTPYVGSLTVHWMAYGN